MHLPGNQTEKILCDYIYIGVFSQNINYSQNKLSCPGDCNISIQLA